MKTLNYLLLGCMVIGLTFMGCGDDECPSCPPSVSPVPDYHLLYSYVGQWPDNYVLTYSTKSGEVIDSAYYHGSMFKSMDFSHDGHYACHTDDYHGMNGYSETWVTDTQTGDTVSYLRGIGGKAVVVSPDDKYVLITSSKQLAVLQLPSLNIVYEDSAGAWVGRFRNSKPEVYVSLVAHPDSMYVLDLDADSLKLRSFPIILYDGTAAESLGPLCILDSLIVLQCQSGQRRFLQIYELFGNELIWQKPTSTQSYIGSALHSPTKRLYLSYNGGFNNPTGGIDVLDLNSRVFRSYIEPGEIILGLDAFVPSNIELTPDGKTLYVLNGDHGFWLGPILEIELATKEVTRRIDNHDGNSWYMRLNPKNWAE